MASRGVPFEPSGEADTDTNQINHDTVEPNKPNKATFIRVKSRAIHFTHVTLPSLAPFPFVLSRPFQRRPHRDLELCKHVSTSAGLP